MAKYIRLTGITTTGTPHLGNYVCATRAVIISSHERHVRSLYFLADYYSLIRAFRFF